MPAVVVAIWSLNDAVSFESLDLLLRRTFFESTGAGYLSISFQHLHLARSSGQLLAWVRSIHGWCLLTWNKTFKARRKSCQIAPRMGGGVLWQMSCKQMNPKEHENVRHYCDIHRNFTWTPESWGGKFLPGGQLLPHKYSRLVSICQAGVGFQMLFLRRGSTFLISSLYVSMIHCIMCNRW